MRVTGGDVQPGKLSGQPIVALKQREEEGTGGVGWGYYEDRARTFSGPDSMKL